MSETKQITAIVTQEDAAHVSKIVQAYIDYLISSANLISNYIEHRPEFKYEAFEQQYLDEKLEFVNKVIEQLDALSVMNKCRYSSEQIRKLEHQNLHIV